MSPSHTANEQVVAITKPAGSGWQRLLIAGIAIGIVASFVVGLRYVIDLYDEVRGESLRHSTDIAHAALTRVEREVSAAAERLARDDTIVGDILEDDPYRLAVSLHRRMDGEGVDAAFYLRRDGEQLRPIVEGGGMRVYRDPRVEPSVDPLLVAALAKLGSSRQSGADRPAARTAGAWLSLPDASAGRRTYFVASAPIILHERPAGELLVGRQVTLAEPGTGLAFALTIDGAVALTAGAAADLAALRAAGGIAHDVTDPDAAREDRSTSGAAAGVADFAVRDLQGGGARIVVTADRGPLRRTEWGVAGAMLFGLALTGLLLQRAYRGALDNARLQRLAAERAHSAAEATRAGSIAQLLQLRAQMQPHFLFNSLNLIVNLLRTEPARASEALNELASLYRGILASSDQLTVPLAEELQTVRHLLQIHRYRFGDRLSYSIAEPPAAIATVTVPSLLLQTLVENAVKHGIAKSLDGGHIDVDVAVVASPMPRSTDRPIGESLEEVTVRIRNTGAPLADDRHAGVGLTNTRERLELHYPGRHGFHLTRDAGGATVVTFNLPRNSP